MGFGLFSQAASDRMRVQSQGRFGLDIRRNFFTVGVLRHWNELPVEVVESLSLKMFKERLDGT